MERAAALAAMQRDRGARAVFATGLAFGLVSLAWLARTRPAMLGVNFHVYHLAGAAVLAGDPLYAVAAPGFPNLPWVYPPLIAVAFVPAALVPWRAAFALHTVGALAAGAALGWAGVRLAGHAGATPDRTTRALAVAFAAVSIHTAPTLFFGNVNLHLAAALALGALAVERGRPAGGTLLALPGLVKVFPAAVGAWLLARRAWRATAAAVGTGLAAVAVSLGTFGVGAHRAYLTEALLPRRRTDVFAGGLPAGADYLTLRRPLSQVLPGHPDALGPLAVALLAPPVGWVLWRAWTRDGDATGGLVALHAVVAGVLLALPSYPIYYVFLVPTVVALALALEGRPRRLFLTGALLGNLSVTYGDAAAALGEVPALRAALTVATPPLVGVLATLAACVLWARRRGHGPSAGR